MLCSFYDSAHTHVVESLSTLHQHAQPHADVGRRMNFSWFTVLLPFSGSNCFSSSDEFNSVVSYFDVGLQVFIITLCQHGVGHLKLFYTWNFNNSNEVKAVKVFRFSFLCRRVFPPSTLGEVYLKCRSEIVLKKSSSRVISSSSFEVN